MYISLDKNQKKPLYIQLYEAISEDIVNGRLRYGMKLPSRRELSQEKGISQNTVDGAYRMLLDTGYIISVPRQGYIVSFRPLSYSGDSPWETMASEQVVFSPNGIDVSRMNRAVFAKLYKDIAYNDGVDIFSYVDKGGEFVLRNAISKYLYSFRNVKCSPDRVIVGAGAEYLLNSLAAIFSQSVAFAVENPCEPHFYNVLTSYNNKVISLPYNAGGFDFDALYACEADVLFIDPDSRFPRSAKMSSEERKKLLEWANAKEGRYIIENCCDSEIAWGSEEALCSMDENNRVIYLGSFARSLCPAVKTAYVVLPPEILALWKKSHAYYYALTSKTEQYVLAELINKGYFTNHYKSMRRIYKDKRDYLITCLTEAFGEKVKVCGSSGSTYICVDFGVSADEVKKIARQSGVKLFSLNSYNTDKEDYKVPQDDKVVLGFGDLTKDRISLGMKLLGNSQLM